MHNKPSAVADTDKHSAIGDFDSWAYQDEEGEMNRVDWPKFPFWPIFICGAIAIICFTLAGY